MAGQNLIYLFAAYALIWIALFGYMLFLAQQVSDLRGQLDALRRGRASATPAGEPRPAPPGD